VVRVVQPFCVANIYESLYCIRAAGVRVEVAREKKGERGCSLLPLQQQLSLVFPPQQPPATWLFASLHRPQSIFRYCTYNTPSTAGCTPLCSLSSATSHIDISI